MINNIVVILITFFNIYGEFSKYKYIYLSARQKIEKV